MSGIGIITNPHSKSNKRNPERSKLLSYIVGQEGFQEITNSPEDLKKVAQSFFNQKISILAVNGGDGTLSHTISAFIECYQGKACLPKILVLGGGTMNVVAQNLGIHGTPEYILGKVVEDLGTGQNLNTKRLATIQVEGRYGFLYADGTSATILEEFYRRKKGFLQAIWLGAYLISSSIIRGRFFRKMIKARQIKFHPKPFMPLHHQSLGAYATTLAKLPLGLPMFGKSIRNKDIFRAVTVGIEPEYLVYRFIQICLFHKPGYRYGKHNFDAEELEIVAESPFRYTLDGEVFTTPTNSITIRSGKLLEFIIP
jgi:diacylglycerol kinase family enzyme